MGRTEGFVEALMAAPLGVVLLALLEAGAHPDGGWIGRSPPSATPAKVAAAVEEVGTMSLGRFLDAVVYASVLESGPWIGGAPLNVANGYRHAGARAPIAEAIQARFGDALHAPLDRAAQQWWTDDQLCREPVVPRFVEFENVYGAGQFTLAGLWTVTDPPHRAHDQLVAAWEYEVGPVSRWWLPARPDARVFDVHRPEDWAQLVGEHPRTGRPHPEWELPGVNQHRLDVAVLAAVPRQHGVRTSIRHHLVPDWRSVAARYDGIHLSWAGLITTEGYVSDLPGGDVAMLRYWFSERTLWLADVFGEPRPAPPPALGDWWNQHPGTDPGRLRRPGDALRTMLGR